MMLSKHWVRFLMPTRHLTRAVKVPNAKLEVYWYKFLYISLSTPSVHAKTNLWLGAQLRSAPTDKSVNSYAP